MQMLEPVRLRRIASRGPVWLYRTLYHQAALRGHPPILCNSFPKSGTHLLVGVVSQIPTLRHYQRRTHDWNYSARARVGRQASLDLTLRSLQRCLPGEIQRGHLAVAQAIRQTLRDGAYRHLFIYRDPRDVVVSQFYWWKKLPRPGLRAYRRFATLPSDEMRLAFLITGVRGDPTSTTTDFDYPDIATRFREFGGWLSDAECLPVRFEELVTEDSRPQVLMQILHYIFPDADQSALSSYLPQMVQGTSTSESKTFRKGSSGEWRHHFSESHARLFKEYAGPLLIELGYEKDMKW